MTKTSRITFLLDHEENADPMGEVWEGVSAVGGYDIECEEIEVQPDTDVRRSKKATT